MGGKRKMAKVICGESLFKALSTFMAAEGVEACIVHKDVELLIFFINLCSESFD